MNISFCNYCTKGIPVKPLSLTLLAPAALLAVLITAPAARAQTAGNPVSLVFTPAGQVTTPGGVLNFSGILSNTTAGPVFLNGDSLTFNGPASDLTLDDSPFNSSAPASPGAMGSGTDLYSGDLFTVSADALTQPGTYFGTFEILGGADGNAQSEVAAADFSVTVLAPAAVPEATTTVSFGLLLALGLGAVVVARRRKPTYDPAA